MAFAPANFTMLALGTIVPAEGSRLTGASRGGLTRLVGVATTLVAAFGAVLAVVWLAVPENVAADLIGPACYPLVLPVALYSGTIGTRWCSR